MILAGKGFEIVVVFSHLHDGRRHEHDLAVADAEAHALAHRLERRPR